MKAAGIICEFNPFHNGHKYLIDNVRQALKPDAVVCVMSGNFTQRGDAAIVDKYKRAYLAVKGGADLVLELPVICSVNSASEFAKGGISILKKLDCIETIAFGSECGDVNILKAACSMMLNEDTAFSYEIRKLLDSGISYPKAYQTALNTVFPELNNDLLSKSNNILAAEYIKQAALQNMNTEFYSVKRIGSEHDEMTNEGQYASGKMIRNEIVQRGPGVIKYLGVMPDFSSEIIEKSRIWNKHSDDRYFTLARSCVLSLSAAELSEVLEVSEGLENRLKTAVIKANNTEDFIQSVKSKRYTYSKISRILTQMILGITKDVYRNADIENNVCIRALAFNDIGRSIMKEAADKGIQIVTNINKQLTKDQIDSCHLKFDIKAGDFYSIMLGNDIYTSSDYICNSQYVNI